MKYNPDIHNRRSIRLKGYDYSQNGFYYITICIKNRDHSFCTINNGEILISQCGEIADSIWKTIPLQFNYITLHEYIIMPNHIHGIIEIVHNPVGARFIAPDNETAPNHQGAINQGAINRTPTDTINNPMFRDNVARVVRWFKGRTTFECRKNQCALTWQRNYYEHIIRDEQSYHRIADYIVNNPASWDKDDLYTTED